MIPNRSERKKLRKNEVNEKVTKIKKGFLKKLADPLKYLLETQGVHGCLVG